MKSFLYAIMIASLGITSLGFVGCGKKKEVVKTERIEFEDDMTDEELLAALRMINDEEMADEVEDAEEAEEIAEAAEEESIEDALEEAAIEEDLEDIYKNMTSEEIEEAERQAMAELAALIAQEQEERSKTAMAPDAFNSALDLENMSEEERNQLAEWQQTAASWAQTELALAAEESAALGFKQIEFEKNSATMLPGQEEALQANIKCARVALEKKHDLVIGAHAEANAPHALELSNARAAALRDALIAAGLPEENLHAAGYGSYTSNEASQSKAEVIVC